MKEVDDCQVNVSVPSPGLVLRPPSVCARPGCRLACAVVSMKNPGAEESRRLVVLLEAALLRETRLWKVPVFKDERIQVRHLAFPALYRLSSVSHLFVVWNQMFKVSTN